MITAYLKQQESTIKTNLETFAVLAKSLNPTEIKTLESFLSSLRYDKERQLVRDLQASVGE